LQREHRLTLLLSREEIARGVRRLAEEIRRDYGGRFPLLVAVLKGSFVFLSDLIRELNIPLAVDFIGAESYQSTTTTGRVRLTYKLRTPVKGRDVLLVEDIVDTGLTVNYIMERLKALQPASLRLCALLDKPSRRMVAVKIDYLGFTIPDRFVVGYGLDMDQDYRYLPDIYVVQEA